MSDFVFLKREWTLTQDAFDRLLAWLDADRESAGKKYEEIRKRLTKFFEWQGCPYPEEQTDIAINRVAMKLAEGVEILAANPYTYFSGVGRNVLREYWRQPERSVDGLEKLHPADMVMDVEESNKPELERRLECMERCLQILPSDQRELITEYYSEEKKAKIKTRKKMAERLGIPLNALRIRSCRIRENLEKCITACLNRTPGA